MSLAGTIRWAVVPYTPQPPFRLYGGHDREPVTVASVEPLVAAARSGGDAELTYLVPVKARPLLVLNDPLDGRLREVCGLRLLRLSRLEEEERAYVRAGRDELLFHLDPERHALPEESAAILGAIVRVHVDAIAGGPELSRLTRSELAVIGDRVTRVLGLDVTALAERRLDALRAARRRELPE